jgi:3-deoxy-D-manno-octulosonic-acid transferase
MRSGSYRGPLLLSTITATGKAMALQELETQIDAHIYYPWDVPGVVRRALDSLCPRIYAVMETEIWPNLLLEIKKREIPAYLVNARVSERTFRRALKNRAFWSEILGTFRAIFARSPADEARILEMGADPALVFRVGDSKVDALFERRRNTDRSSLDPLMKGRGPVLIAGSTHPGEEEAVLAAFADVKKALPESRLILAPRHPERAEAVLGLVREPEGACLLSKWVPGWTILVVDRIGVLFDLYARSDAAFIGGSLVPKGGQNLLEPLAWGLPVLHGPHMEDFQDLASQAEKRGLTWTVETPGQLAAAWIESIFDGKAREEFARRCSVFLESLGGASAKAWEKIEADNKNILWE